jgi:3-oxoacyl-(acyl-carrier-protein) synthase
MASPNAFANGVNNAALAAISTRLGLTRGGLTLVGYENCGLEALHEAARAVARGTYDICYAGGAEEYSALVDEVYGARGWYDGSAQPAQRIKTGCCIAEGSVFFVVSKNNATSPMCLYEPVVDLADVRGNIDLVISGAGNGPQDQFEFEALAAVTARQAKPPAVIFPKSVFGELFAASALLSVAIGCDILVNQAKYAELALPPISPSRYCATYLIETIHRVLVIAAGRQGEISAGVLWRP